MALQPLFWPPLPSSLPPLHHRIEHQTIQSPPPTSSRFQHTMSSSSQAPPTRQQKAEQKAQLKAQQEAAEEAKAQEENQAFKDAPWAKYHSSLDIPEKDVKTWEGKKLGEHQLKKAYMEALIHEYFGISLPMFLEASRLTGFHSQSPGAPPPARPGQPHQVAAGESSGSGVQQCTRPRVQPPHPLHDEEVLCQLHQPADQLLPGAVEGKRAEHSALSGGKKLPHGGDSTRLTWWPCRTRRNYPRGGGRRRWPQRTP